MRADVVDTLDGEACDASCGTHNIAHGLGHLGARFEADFLRAFGEFRDGVARVDRAVSGAALHCGFVSVRHPHCGG